MSGSDARPNLSWFGQRLRASEPGRCPALGAGGLQGRLPSSFLAGSGRRWRPKLPARAPVRGVLAVPKVIGCTEGAGCAEGDPMWRIRSTSATPVAMQRGASWRQSAQWHLAAKRKVVARRRACRALRHGDSRRSGISPQRGRPQLAVRSSSKARDLPWHDAGGPLGNSTIPRCPR